MTDYIMSEDQNIPLFAKGTVLTTIFQNAAEHFSIIRVQIDDTNLDYDDKEIC